MLKRHNGRFWADLVLHTPRGKTTGINVPAPKIPRDGQQVGITNQGLEVRLQVQFYRQLTYRNRLLQSFALPA